MQLAQKICTYLLAFVFIVIGSDYFLHFMPMPPLEGDVKNFNAFMGESGYLDVVKALEIVIGFLLLWPKTRALAYILIAPIIVNIILFEVLIAHQLGLGIVLLLIDAFLIWSNREKYQSIMQ